MKRSKQIKRITSVLLAIVMLCAFVPASAAETETDTVQAAASSISIGDYVQMGTYYGQPILWRCVDIDDNGPLMLSDKILCIKAYDAEGDNTSGSHSRNSDRQSWGSNYWADSNMRSWLNSTASAGNVTWLCGNPPDEDHVWSGYNEYDQEAGFLSSQNFTTSEISAIKEVTQKSIVAYPEYDNGIYTMGSEAHEWCSDISEVVANYDSAYAENVTDKMFLLDVKQVNAVYNNRAILGDEYYIGQPTAECVANSEYKSSYLAIGENWYYWLRSPDADYVNTVRYVDSGGHVHGDSARSSYRGVRPAFYLNLSSVIFKSGSGTEAVPYVIDGNGSGGGGAGAAPIIKSAEAGGKNLFTNKISVDKDSADSYSISVTIDTNGCSDVHAYITQGSGSATEIPLDACRDVKLGQIFDSGQPIYITAIDKATGKSASKRTKLSIVGSSGGSAALSGGAIKLVEDFGFTIPDGVPVLNNQKISFSLGSVSSDVNIDGNEFKVVVGVDSPSVSMDGSGWKENEWEGIKSGIKSAKDKMSSGLSGYKYLKNIATKGTKLQLQNSASANATVAGYLEGYIDGSELHISEGGIIMSSEVKYKYQGMTVVMYVPVYYEFGAGGGLEFVGGVKDLVPGNGLQGAFTGSLTPSISAEIGGGIGIPMIATAGASGKAKAEFKIALNKIYQKLDVTGSANVKLTIGFITYEKPFAQGTYHIYETGNKNTLLGKTLGLASEDNEVSSANDLFSLIDIDEPQNVDPHSESAQTWVGDKSDVVQLAEYTNQEVQVLEEDSNENIAPVLANMDGKNVIAWITDNKSRADGDKNMLVYSVQENGTWSAPKAVYDDGFADFSPSMKDGYIVWQKATTNISDGTTLRDFGSACEIYLAKWNGDGFETPMRLTNNSCADLTPKLAVNNGSPAVVWIQNSDGDITGLSGTNSLMSYSGAITKTEAATTGAIPNFDCEYIDGTLNMVYEIDSDMNYSTLTDREIYSISEGRLTNNSVADTHPVYGEINGSTTVFYYTDGKLVYLENGIENTVTDNVSTDQFDVVSNDAMTAVLWTTTEDGSAEIHGSLYRDGEWSEDIQISDLSERIKFPSAIMDNSGKIFAAFNRTQKVSDGDDYYVDGQTDLCTIGIMPAYDLEITDAYVDEENHKAYVTIKNVGELDIDSFDIKTDYVTTSETMSVTEPLKAGEEREFEVSYSETYALAVKNITITAEQNSGDEYDMSNNSVTLAVCNADIDVENVTVNDTETSISADISNIGKTDANSVTVSLRADNADGTVLDTKTISLVANASKNVEFSFDKSGMKFLNAKRQLYITAECGLTEAVLGNNDGYAYITSPSGEADYLNSILDYTNANGEYIINSAVVNNTDTDTECIVYAAVYNADDTLKGFGTQNVTIGANNDTGVDITLNCDLGSGDTVKTFLWDSIDSMQPLAEASELAIE